jgi:hypothetical protein
VVIKKNERRGNRVKVVPRVQLNGPKLSVCLSVWLSVTASAPALIELDLPFLIPWSSWPILGRWVFLSMLIFSLFFFLSLLPFFYKHFTLVIAIIITIVIVIARLLKRLKGRTREPKRTTK